MPVIASCDYSSKVRYHLIVLLVLDSLCFSSCRHIIYFTVLLFFLLACAVVEISFQLDCGNKSFLNALLGLNSPRLIARRTDLSETAKKRAASWIV